MIVFEILMLATLAIGQPAISSASSNATVRLRAQAIPSSSILTLGDLAEVLCNDSQRATLLRNAEIGPSPAPGESKWYDVNFVRDQLHRRGVDLSSVEFSGGRRVEVAVPRVEQPAPEKPTPTGNWESVIAKMLTANVLERTGWEAHRVAVTFEGKRAIEYLEKTNPLEWELLVPARWQVGRHVATLEVPTTGESVRFTLQVYLTVKQPVLFARRPIARGEALTAADVELLDAPVDQESIRNLFVDPANIKGMIAARDIPVGRPMESKDVKSDPIVFRGSQVTVSVRHGTAAVQITAYAQEDGGKGEWITVVNPSTRKRLDQKVRVTGPQTAELTDDAPPADDAPERGKGSRDGEFARRGE
ncbi:MAG: flagellar basal body P-ring formation chaperone FlgA [Planctomycetota bacterium]